MACYVWPAYWVVRGIWRWRVGRYRSVLLPHVDQSWGWTNDVTLIYLYQVSFMAAQHRQGWNAVGTLYSWRWHVMSHLPELHIGQFDGLRWLLRFCPVLMVVDPSASTREHDLLPLRLVTSWCVVLTSLPRSYGVAAEPLHIMSECRVRYYVVDNVLVGWVWNPK